MSGGTQRPEELDAFYERPDPWGYRTHPDDERRRMELLAILPRREHRRCLDIGCGDGFVTHALPAREVVGIDASEKAVQWARQNNAGKADAARFRFENLSLFDPRVRALGRFDLVVITGVLYEQYIGKGRAVVRCLVDDLLEDGGTLVSCHIREWSPLRFPYGLLDMTLYPYREYAHQLEAYKK